MGLVDAAREVQRGSIGAVGGRPGLRGVVEVEGNRAASRLQRGGEVTGPERVDLTQGDQLRAEAAMIAGVVRGPGFQRLDPHVRVIESAHIQRDPGPGRAQPRILSNGLVGQQIQPAGDGRQSAAVEFVDPVRGDQIRTACDVTGSDQVAHRLIDKALALEPGRDSSVQTRDEIGLGALELGAQQLPEQVVIPIPVTRHVQGHHKQVVALDLLQDRRRARGLQHRVAQRTAESSQDRGAQQEAAQLRRLPVEDLGHQIVDDMAVIARERPDERGGITTIGKREGGKVEACSPPFGASVQKLNVSVSQVQSEHIVQ